VCWLTEGGWVIPPPLSLFHTPTHARAHARVCAYACICMHEQMAQMTQMTQVVLWLTTHFLHARVCAYACMNTRHKWHKCGSPRIWGRRTWPLCGPPPSSTAAGAWGCAYVGMCMCMCMYMYVYVCVWEGGLHIQFTQTKSRNRPCGLHLKSPKKARKKRGKHIPDAPTPSPNYPPKKAPLPLSASPCLLPLSLYPAD
jgi:hypothetical protein